MMTEFVASVFGYGSLINPASANNTLERPSTPTDFAPAVLVGYQRCWQVLSTRKPSSEGPPPQPSVVLDIVPRPGCRMNGVVFAVTAGELARLDQRERHYRRIEVTDQIESNFPGPIFTYQGLEAHTQPPPGSIITRRYWNIVEEGCLLFGRDFHQIFIDSTLPFPWAIEG